MKSKLKFMTGCLIAFFLIPFLITFVLSGVGLEKDKIGLALTAVFTGNSRAKSTVTMSYAVGTEEMDIDEYIVGVLAPALEYCDNGEFLKTMAVLCRTYAYYCNASGALFETHFYTDTEMKEIWGSSWEQCKAALRLAVEQTRGQYLTCSGQVIYPYCHIMTSGCTRNLREETEYLCSVSQTEDSMEEDYVTVIDYTAKEFGALLKQSLTDLYLDENNPAAQLQIVEKTEGGYVVLCQVGNLMLDGDTLSDILKLPSPSFVCSSTENGVRFTVKGEGKGYGLSIAGARRKALEGLSYKEIINYYYRSIVFSASDM